LVAGVVGQAVRQLLVPEIPAGFLPNRCRLFGLHRPGFLLLVAAGLAEVLLAEPVPQVLLVQAVAAGEETRLALVGLEEMAPPHLCLVC
jgi:hypothetical protein